MNRRLAPAKVLLNFLKPTAMQKTLKPHVSHQVISVSAPGSHQSSDESADLYERAMALKPDSVDAYHDWGVLLARQGKRKQAEAKFRRALEIQPNNVLARENLDQLLRESVGNDE